MINEKKYNDTHGGVLLLLVLLIIMYIYLFGGSNFDIRYPLSLVGGDETSYLSEVKMFLTDNTGLKTSDLGGIYGTDRTATMSYYLDNDIRFFSYIFVKIFDNVGMAVNLTYMVSFALNAFVTYFVLISRKVNGYIASMGAFLFATQRYVFYRNVGHLMLTMIYTIPLGILLCLWICDDDEFLRFDKQFFKKKRNLLAIVFSFLIVNSGIGYYMFFACLLLVVTGVGKTITKGTITGIVQAVKTIGLIAISLFVILIPYFYNRYVQGGIGIENIRSMGDAELYNLKIFRMLFPMEELPLDNLNAKMQEYYSVAVCQTETTEYLGLVGILGMIIMTICLIKKSEIGKKSSDIRIASLMTIFILLYATIGGLGTAVFVFLFDMARCTNRMSVYICFLCILSICIVMDNCIKKISNVKKKGFAIMCGICLFGLCVKAQWIQDPYDNTAAKNVEVELTDFVGKVENVASDNALVLELPFQNYPSGPFRNNMAPNALLLPYLYSNDIRWSYGSFIGEKSYEINEETSQGSIAAIFLNAKKVGYEGILIDTYAFAEQELEDVLDFMGSENSTNHILSTSGRWIYIY